MATRAEILQGLQVPDGDFVVEVGGGHQPFARADLIIDKYPFDNLHRSLDLVHGAPVIIGDASHLPIADGACGLLFASHVIEHLPRPDLFLQEVRRCARRVYLEFPSRYLELMFGWRFHEWLVQVEGSHLRFYRNDLPQLFGETFHRSYDLMLDAFLLARPRVFNGYVSCAPRNLTWEFPREGAFEHVVATSARGADKVNVAAQTRVQYSWFQVSSLMVQRALPAAAFQKLVQLRRRSRAGRPRPLTQRILNRLLCLKCSSVGLADLAGDVVCPACDAVYTRRHGLVDMDVISEDRTVAGPLVAYQGVH